MKRMWANGENCGPKADQSEDLKIRTKYLFHRVRMRHYVLTNWKSSLPVQVGKIKKNQVTNACQDAAPR